MDLKDHRAELKLALEKAQYDVECMEMYSAFEAPGQMPGYWSTEANPDRRSITQLEPVKTSRNPIKPQLVFMVVPIIPG